LVRHGEHEEVEPAHVETFFSVSETMVTPVSHEGYFSTGTAEEKRDEEEKESKDIIARRKKLLKLSLERAEKKKNSEEETGRSEKIPYADSFLAQPETEKNSEYFSIEKVDLTSRMGQLDLRHFTETH
jgi:hypothetical protein